MCFHQDRARLNHWNCVLGGLQSSPQDRLVPTPFPPIRPISWAADIGGEPLHEWTDVGANVTGSGMFKILNLRSCADDVTQYSYYYPSRPGTNLPTATIPPPPITLPSFSFIAIVSSLCCGGGSTACATPPLQTLLGPPPLRCLISGARSNGSGDTAISTASLKCYR